MSILRGTLYPYLCCSNTAVLSSYNILHSEPFYKKSHIEVQKLNYQGKTKHRNQTPSLISVLFDVLVFSQFDIVTLIGLNVT